MRLDEITERSTNKKAPGNPTLDSQEYEKKKPVEEIEKEPLRDKKKNKRVRSWKTKEIFNDWLCKVKVR